MKTLKTIKKIVHIKITVLVILLLPILVFILVTSKTDFMGIRSFVVLTGSMTPTLPVGSISFTIESNTYYPNDVIAFRQGDVVVTHRITNWYNQKNELLYETKGDANNAPDQTLVPAKNIIGKNIFQIPYIGNILFYIKTLPGFITLVIFPTLIFILLEMWNIKRELEKEIEKKYIRRFEIPTY